MDRFEALRGLKRFAILGGTFDPIHNGHLETARQILKKTDVEKVIFVPAGVPPHKEILGVTDGESRLKMVSLALKNEPLMAVSDLEVHRAGTTYTVDTVEELRRELGEDVSFSFVMGADALFYLSSWKNYRRLLEICKFLVVTRPGYDTSRLKALVQQLEEEYHGELSFLEIPPVEVSSSQIRQAVKEGRSIQRLLPEAVEQFIRIQKLYRN